MSKEGASFVITGEVVGQRPMSQRKNTMRLIEKESGLDGLVLRPLSAKILAATIPEKQGWIIREKLLSIQGRGRRPQMDLADEFEIKDYPCPSGGCLLTDPEFCKRLKDILRFDGLNLSDIPLLKIGRHFRLSNTAKLVVGRNEKENTQLLNLAKPDDYVFKPKEIAGPTALGRGEYTSALIELSCAITCRYCDLGEQGKASIIYKKLCEKKEESLNNLPLDEQSIKNLRV